MQRFKNVCNDQSWWKLDIQTVLNLCTFQTIHAGFNCPSTVKSCREFLLRKRRSALDKIFIISLYKYQVKLIQASCSLYSYLSCVLFPQYYRCINICTIQPKLFLTFYFITGGYRTINSRKRRISFETLQFLLVHSRSTGELKRDHRSCSL